MSREKSLNNIKECLVDTLFMFVIIKDEAQLASLQLITDFY